MSRPIFKDIFGSDWDALPKVMKRHYDLRPDSDQKITVNGFLDVSCKPYLTLLSPVMRLLGLVPAKNAKNVPVTVHFFSSDESLEFHFHRIFHFKDQKSYHFRSRMIQHKDNEVYEIMGGGITWKMKYLWEDGTVKLRHNG